MRNVRCVCWSMQPKKLARSLLFHLQPNQKFHNEIADVRDQFSLFVVFAGPVATLLSFSAQPLVVRVLRLEAARLRRQRLQLFVLGVVLGAEQELFALLACHPGSENALVLVAPFLQLQLLLLRRMPSLGRQLLTHPENIAFININSFC